MKTKRNPKTKLPAPVHAIETRAVYSLRAEREAFQKQHPDLIVTNGEFRETNGETFYTLEAWKPEDFLKVAYPKLTLAKKIQQWEKAMDFLESNTKLEERFRRWKGGRRTGRKSEDTTRDARSRFLELRAEDQSRLRRHIVAQVRRELSAKGCAGLGSDMMKIRLRGLK